MIRFARVLALCLLAVVPSAYSQTASRDLTLSWTAPTSCAGGGAISTCAILGYSVQELLNGTWTQIGTTAAGVVTYVHRNVPVGPHSYRVLATSAGGSSDPSNVVTRPDVPGAPGNLVISVTVNVTATGVTVVPQ